MRAAGLPQATLVHGDSRQMALIESATATLVLTSPPYFDPVRTAPRLQESVRLQTAPDVVAKELGDYACSLAPCFSEMVRVRQTGGVIVLQTKDIRYGGVLLTLAHTHRALMEAQGMHLISRVFWRKFSSRRRRSQVFQATRKIGTFEADDTEEYLIFAGPEGITRQDVTSDVTEEEAAVWASPLWETPGAGGSATHPYQSPPEPIRRFIRLFTRPGDLVVDPFAGHATTLCQALQLGRRAIGYEIDEAHALAGSRRVEAVLRERKEGWGKSS